MADHQLVKSGQIFARAIEFNVCPARAARRVKNWKIKLVIVGAKFGDIVAYWVGSSSGSAQKAAALEKAVAAGGGR